MTKNNLFIFLKKTTDGGTRVLPVAFKGKTPIIRGWPETSSCDSDQIEKWFKDKKINAGIPTGIINGFWVLDIDKKSDGYKSLRDLEKQCGPIIDNCSYVVETGGGGLHALYKLRDNDVIPSLTNILPGIDVRGEGGQIVSPFSTHESGNLYLPRIEHEDKALYIDQLKFAPEELISFIGNYASRKNISTNKMDTKSDIGISAIGIQSKLKFREGSRNSNLHRLMSAVRNSPLSSDGLIAAGRAENLLRCDPPLDDDEVLRIVKSVYERYQPNIILEPQIAEFPQSVPAQFPRKCTTC
jgi:putative DNA primase/helicase